MAVPAATLRTLHRIHRQLTDLRSRLDRGPKQIAFAEANLTTLSGVVDSAKEDVKKAQLTTNQKELQLKEREAGIEATRTKLNTASSNKEYQAFVEKIAADEQANSVLSDEILEMFDKVEDLQKVVKEKEAELNQAKGECDQLRKRVNGEKQSLEEDVARPTGECKELEVTLPADIKSDFDRIVGTRGEDGLAVIEEGFCGHCNQAVNSQMINELMMEEKMILCKSCGAILYLPENLEPIKGGE